MGEVVDIPSFYGDDPEGWVSWVEAYGSDQGFSDGERVQFAYGFVEGDALTWFVEENAKSPFDSWIELKQRILRRFGKGKKTSDAVQKIFHEEGFESFNTESNETQPDQKVTDSVQNDSDLVFLAPSLLETRTEPLPRKEIFVSVSSSGNRFQAGETCEKEQTGDERAKAAFQVFDRMILSGKKKQIKRRKRKFSQPKRSKYKWGKRNPNALQIQKEVKSRNQNNGSLKRDSELGFYRKPRVSLLVRRGKMAMRHLSRSKDVAKRSTKKYIEEPLYHLLFKNGGTEISVRQQLNQFLKGTKHAFKWAVGDTIKKLRSRGLYYPALQLSEVMEERGMNKTVSDPAIHLDLVAKARGVTAGENYFVDLPETSKTELTYGSLLNCYCKELMTEKAEGLLNKMKELNITPNSISYNSLMTLYTKTGQHEKVPTMIQEMKAENVMPDSYTYNVWMRALAATTNDVSGVERVIEEMNRDGRVAPDWTTYSNMASIYVDAGLSDKAVKALQELEMKNTKRDFTAYQFLITLYGRLGKMSEVYRIWRSLRLAMPKTSNVAYLNMIQVLVNLKDLPGAEALFKEWQSNCSTYDIRVVNVMIGAYARESLIMVKAEEPKEKDPIKKAKELKEKAPRRGAKPNAKTWEIFMDYYVTSGDIPEALECMSKAVSIGKGDGGKWLPSQETVGILMSYFEETKDVNGAENLVEILKKGTDNISAEIFESLVRTYTAAGKSHPAMRRRLKMENVEVSEATKKLLDEVCQEQ